jgi:hypothetical protein
VKYATWNLKLDNSLGEITGPESLVLSQGYSIHPIINIGDVNNHYILGTFENNIEDLSFWDFTEIDRDSAILLYSENFIEILADPETLRPAFTLESGINFNFNS